MKGTHSLGDELTLIPALFVCSPPSPLVSSPSSFFLQDGLVGVHPSPATPSTARLAMGPARRTGVSGVRLLTFIPYEAA